MVDGREGTKAGRERKDHSPSQQFLNLPLTGDAVKTFSEELNYRQQKNQYASFCGEKSRPLYTVEYEYQSSRLTLTLTLTSIWTQTWM